MEYQGHRISPDGLKPLPSKVEAIVAAPPPTDVSQLKSSLVLLIITAIFGQFGFYLSPSVQVVM